MVDELPTPAERLEWLFGVVCVPTLSHTGEHEWRPLTREEVTDRLHAQLGRDRVFCRTLLDRVQSGDSATSAELDAIASCFGAPLAVFGDNPARVAEAQDTVLTQALADCQVTHHRVCRVSVLVGRHRLEVLRQAVSLARQVAESFVETVTTPTRAWDYVVRRSGGGAMSTRRPMSDAEMLALCRQLLSDLDIALPVTPIALCRALSKARGRRIKLVAVELGTVTSVGHLTCKANRDLIAFHHSASSGQQAHVIYHEIMHLVCGHVSGTDSLTCGALEPVENLDRIVAEAEEEATLYTAWQECEAERGATILSELSRHRPVPKYLPRDAGYPERNIAAAFGMA